MKYEVIIPIPIDEVEKEIIREIEMRKSLYQKKVKIKEMTADEAIYRIMAMQSNLTMIRTYRKIQDAARQHANDQKSLQSIHLETRKLFNG